MTKSYFIVMILMALVSNTDNFAVGISYGTRKLLIPFISNIIIALITGIGTLLSMLLGKEISNILDPKEATVLGAGIIIIVGVLIVIKETLRIIKGDKKDEELKNITNINLDNLGIIGRIPKVLQNPFLADWDFSGCISIGESVILGCALALNNMANGIGAGLAGLNPFATAIFAFVISLLVIWIGIKLGHDYIYNSLGKLSAPLAGVILIIIGIYEMFC